MIETEKQQRWWFATHPEYSRSSNGKKNRGHTEQEPTAEKKETVRPEDVDAYVDNALQHVRGPVAELLKSVKRNFGTEADSPKGGQGSSVIVAQQNRDSAGRGLPLRQHPAPFGSHGNDRWRLTGYRLDGGAFTPRLPTTAEFLRWPAEMARRYIRSLNTFLQRYPFLIDPNAPERHHGLPKQWEKHFKDAGINIEEFIIVMTVAKHRLKPDGLHTGKGRGGDWNTRWKKFFSDNKPTNTPEFQRKVRKEYEKMKKESGLE